LVKILGHRGSCHNPRHAGNTRGAFEDALAHVDGIEADISVSRDGTAYVVHDMSVKFMPRLFTRSYYNLGSALSLRSRFIARGRRLDQMTDDEIGRLTLRGGGRIMRLTELFSLAARHPRKIFNLELKNADAAQAVFAEFGHAASLHRVRKEQVIVSSFDADTLIRMRALDPEMKRALVLLPPGCKPAPIYPWLEDRRGLYRAFGAAAFESNAVQAAAPHYLVVTAATASPIAAWLVSHDMPRAKFLIWTPKENLPFRDRILHHHLQHPEVAARTHAVITSYPTAMAAKLKTS
jgi:glycerophosphoryl diester phosphodiesterase